MLAIRAEIDRVGAGEWPADDNPLRNAPHTAEDVAADDWKHALHAGGGGLPVAGLRAAKYWPPVRRIDGAYGDRNLVCACPPIEAYALSADPNVGRCGDTDGADGSAARQATNGVGTTRPGRATPRHVDRDGVAVLGDVGRQEGQGDAVAEHGREVAAGDLARRPRRRPAPALALARRAAALGGDARAAAGDAPLLLGLEGGPAPERRPCPSRPPSRGRPAAA